MPEAVAVHKTPDTVLHDRSIRPIATASLLERLTEHSRLLDRDEAARRVRELTEQALANTGRGLDLTQTDLSGLDLSGFDLRRATLNRASLYGTKLAQADLSGASMVCAGLERTDFSGAVLRGAYIHALAAQASSFAHADLTGLLDATGALFHGCDLTEARLNESELAGTAFYQCSLLGAQVIGADLHGAVFNECRMDRADLTRAHLDDVTITRCGISGLIAEHARGHGLVIQRPAAADGVRLASASLPLLRLTLVRGRGLNAAGLHAPGIDVSDCHLPGMELSGADLSHGRWQQVAMSEVKLADAVLTDSSLRQVTAADADFAAATGEGLTATECTFAGANFAGFRGRYATFRNCDFRSADMRRAYLYRSSFIGDPPASACMTGVNLDGANLTQAYLAADFTGASIRHVLAVYARLNQSIFDQADLRGTSLFRTSAVKTQFIGAQVSGHRGAIFADRCAGLLTALREATDPDSQRTAQLVEELTALLNGDAGKST